MTSSKTTSMFLAVAVTILSAGQVSAREIRPQTSWPKLITGSKSPECMQVFKAAKLAFNAGGSQIDENTEAVKNADMGLVLAPEGSAVEVAGAKAFWFDAQYIDTNAREHDNVPSLYWQKVPIKGGKFLVGQKKMNWQGDWYDLYFVNADLPLDRMESIVNDAQKESQAESTSIPEGSVIYRNLWHRPWFFYNKQSKNFIAVNVQSNWLSRDNNFFPDWKIYAPDGGSKVKLIGTIKFAPNMDAFKLLPRGPLRELALLLDKIIGIPKGDEGTFQATPRLKADAAFAWANLIIRPWAMAEPSNSLNEVEAGLKRWSKGSPVYKKQYAQLKALYPMALQSLTEYYQTSGKLPPAAARKLATKALDRAYRSNFKF
ncbi:MAG: hypothetical protein JSS83_16875 [Cyanobacteria bacterium SZAS LIN-3]|nr:hypothetical protein [Cyanobacteria bacterium SZAS LIN-3]